MKKTIIQVESEISAIIKDNYSLADRIKALDAAGYKDIAYVYVKNKCINNKGGIGSLFIFRERKYIVFRLTTQNLRKITLRPGA